MSATALTFIQGTFLTAATITACSAKCCRQLIAAFLSASGLHDERVVVQAEGESMSLGLLLRQIESGVNIFSDLEKDVLQGRAAS